MNTMWIVWTNGWLIRRLARFAEMMLREALIELKCKKHHSVPLFFFEKKLQAWGKAQKQSTNNFTSFITGLWKLPSVWEGVLVLARLGRENFRRLDSFFFFQIIFLLVDLHNFAILRKLRLYSSRWVSHTRCELFSQLIVGAFSNSCSPDNKRKASPQSHHILSGYYWHS